MKTVWVGTSWKMNKTLAEAQAFCQQLQQHLPCVPETIQPFIIPPFTCVREVSQILAGSRCLTGVQNMHYADQGAFTGEISPPMVQECGARLVELGHSERRAYFAESDLTIQKKVQAALCHALRPLVCVGDSAQERAWGVSQETVLRQMKIALSGVTAQQVLQVIIAYEPIWAIGEGGEPATPAEAQQIHAALRSALCEQYGAEIAQQVVLLYGGSVNADNLQSLIQQQDIDGVFVGRAAWQPAGYCQLLTLAGH